MGQTATFPPGRAQGRLLITGAAGFVGRALVRRGRALGLEVLPATRAETDLRDPEAIRALLRRTVPDFAIDAAGVLPGQGDVTANVAMTRAWLAALGAGAMPPRLVLIGSAAIYGAGAPAARATRESDATLPAAAYGRAKLAALSLARAAHAETGADVQTGIVFNLTGPGQPAQLAPQVFIDMALDAPEHRHEVGPVDTVRDFLDVDDAADALIAMALNGPPGSALNVATGQPTRIGDVLDRLSQRLGARWDRRESGGADICYGDPGRLMATTGWHPRLSFNAALDRAIDAGIATRQHRKEA